MANWRDNSDLRRPPLPPFSAATTDISDLRRPPLPPYRPNMTNEDFRKELSPHVSATQQTDFRKELVPLSHPTQTFSGDFKAELPPYQPKPEQQPQQQDWADKPTDYHSEYVKMIDQYSLKNTPIPKKTYTSESNIYNVAVEHEEIPVTKKKSIFKSKRGEEEKESDTDNKKKQKRY